MNRYFRLVHHVAALALLVLAGLERSEAALDAAPEKECAAIQNAVNAHQPVPRDLLKQQAALSCLVRVIDGMKATISSVKAVSTRSDLLQASRAIRIILSENLVSARSEFRRIDNHDVISVLSFGARGDNFDIRLNTTTVLGDVIDNHTVCVTLDHLYDPEISPNGRANLIAVVSVVAEWATAENAENIETMIRHMRKTLPKNLPDTVRIIDHLENKLAKREPPAASVAASALKTCRSYKPHWAGSNLKY